MDVGAVKTLLGLELFAFISLFPASSVFFVHPFPDRLPDAYKTVQDSNRLTLDGGRKEHRNSSLS